uniref:phosphatidylinositol-3,4,5-trisphosphate 5-phosphatase n=1 Tax=Taeniopygia guttata TaxID=59729 RepID=A0A674HPM3_TAEGU
MAAAGWYHRDISQVVAEELLARAGRDGSFLVRDSESVKGAYALCLLFQRHVYTYRILPDDEGLLSVQTIQGIQAKCFHTLPDLIGAYQHPNNGLVTPLLHPVRGGPAELVTLPARPGPASDFMGFVAEYLTHHVHDLEALCHLSAALATACRALHRSGAWGWWGWSGDTARGGRPCPHHPSPVLSSLKRGSSSPEELIPQDKSKRLLCSCWLPVGPFGAVGFPATGYMPCHTPVPHGGSPCPPDPHHSVLQLIKYQSVQSKVRLVCARENQKSLSRDFVFPNARKREAFCQLLQLMKIQHSNLDEPEIISVYVGTWNMGSTPPPRSLASWLTSRGLGRTQDETTACIPHDIYVIGTQENSLGDREWVEFLCASLKSLMAIDYRVVALQCLWSIKIVVLVKPEHQRRISHVHTSSVKTGIANTLGNKGAVGVSFLFNGTSFGFINCHLASGSEKTHRRNQNYSDILHSLTLGDKRLGGFDLTLRFTHLFWLGDLNYRLDMDVQDILSHIVKKEFQALLAVDQLNLEREKNKVFLRFSEGDISFPPTYRYERGTRDTYVWQKSKPTGVRINVPSWCDRILWKSHPETHVVCNSYGCTDDIVTSDHSPVFATFEVGVMSQFVPKEAPGSSPEALACIEWESVEVILKTTSRSKCYIEFHSYCLEEVQRSGENTFQNCDIPGFLKLGWSSKHLPVLNPILPDLEYLGDQHLLLSFKGVESCESYGECCLALRSAIGSTARQFETFLFHRGEETGSVRGWMRVRVPRGRRGTREKLYGNGGRTQPPPGAPGSGTSRDTCSSGPRPRCAPSLPRSASGTPGGLGRAGAPEWGDAEPFLSPSALRRSRPRSLPEPTTDYTNPAYFIFEGVPTARLPAPGEAPKKPAEGPAGGQQCRSPAGPRLPLPSEEQPWCDRPRCGPPSPSRGHPLSAPRAGHHQRPKSAVLTRDTLGLGDCSLDVATQLDQASAQCRGDIQEISLRQSHPVPEPPPRPCREPPRPPGKRGALGASEMEVQPPPPADLQPARI